MKGIVNKIENWFSKPEANRISPVYLLILGYLSLTLICFFIICLPISRKTDISWIDQIFLSTSIVSTTGLSPLNFGESISLFGQIATLIFIQLGGVGYMALISFFIFKHGNRLPKISASLLRLEFNLPDRYPLLSFIYSVFIFTIIIELIGTLFLYYEFLQHGVDQPLWSAIFHSVSAFCTAGFSLYGDSMSSFENSHLINNTIMTLSIFGSIGFIVLLDFWLVLVKKRTHVTLTSKIILVSTIAYIFIGTILLFFSDGVLVANGFDGFQKSFFQLVSAHTTVGFNNYPIEDLKLGGILILIIIMVIGASPSGTGGGIKTTSVTALIGLIYSILKQKNHITFFNKEIPAQKIYLAITSTIFYTFILLFGTWIVVQIDGDRFSFGPLLFETASALSTVGLTTGITDDLSGANKLVLCFLMFIGRLGVMTFGFALTSKSPLMRNKPKLEDIAV